MCEPTKPTKFGYFRKQKRPNPKSKIDLRNPLSIKGKLIKSIPQIKIP